MKRFKPGPTFYSVHFKAEKIVATEEELDRIYDASYKGLTGDDLAVAAGFLPKDLAILCQADPLAELAMLQGRADSKSHVSGAAIRNALAGDTKAAAFVLTHLHGWKPAKPESDANSDIRIIVENTLPIPKIDD